MKKKTAHLSALNQRRTVHGLRLVDSRTGQRLLVAVPRSGGPELIAYVDARAVETLLGAGLPPTTASKRVERGTGAWYAALIREDVAALRVAMAGEERGRIAGEALHLGALLAEADIVKNHGAAYKTGEGNYRGLSLRRDAHNAHLKVTAEREHRKWIAEAKDIWRRNPGHGVTRCAGLVIAKLGLRAANKTVADAIRPHRPKKVGDAS
jgi:hypothetical protein